MANSSTYREDMKRQYILLLILLMGMANRVTVKTDSWGYALLLCAWK
jgi:hypothetical protein